MILQLDKKDVLSMVLGTQPYYDKFADLKRYGHFMDNESWVWDEYRLMECSIEELWNIYLVCKYSWK